MRRVSARCLADTCEASTHSFSPRICPYRPQARAKTQINDCFACPKLAGWSERCSSALHRRRRRHILLLSPHALLMTRTRIALCGHSSEMIQDGMGMKMDSS